MPGLAQLDSATFNPSPARRRRPTHCRWPSLLLLERLSPVERAVFLLHDVLPTTTRRSPFAVDKSEAGCRQLALRARRHVESEKPRFEASRVQRDELVCGVLLL